MRGTPALSRLELNLAKVEFKRLEALEKQVKQERILDERLRTQQMLGQAQQ